MFKLLAALKKIMVHNMNPKVPALLRELEVADTYIEFLREAIARGYEVQIAVIVDNQVCPSTTMARPASKTGGMILDYLQQAALGERMRLWIELEAAGAKPGKGP